MTRLLLTCALTLALGAASAVALAQPADRIWSGGTVLTMDDHAMRVQAVAERDGRIVAVGTRAQVMKLRGPATRLIDLKGRTLVPGFVDGHGHVMMGGLQALAANLLAPPDGRVTDIASLQQTLRDWTAANADAVKQIDLIVGFGYDPSTLAEQRHPTRDDLDAVSTDVPIMLIHQSGHLAAFNSKALEVAGVTAQSVDPAGGVIRRRPDSQEPDGVLEETAMIPAGFKLMGRVGVDGSEAFFRAGTALWARFGYTTAQDGRTMPPQLAVMRRVADTGALKIDVASYPDVMVDRDVIKANLSPTYRNRLRVAGAKLSLDGSPQGFTAWRDRPYYAPVGRYPKGYAGYPAVTTAQAIDAIDWAYANDVQLLTHANGEAASDLLIAAHTVAQLKHGADKGRALRHVLIHGQFLRPDQVDAYQRLNIMPSLFPMHTFYWGDWHVAKTVGPVLGPNISPTGWLRQRGMIFTSHHDAPVAFPDSMRVLDATVTRVARGSGKVIGPHQRVDVITGLKSMTLWAAWQYGEEAAKGSIEVGKLADFAILSRDPTRGDPNTIDRIRVTETVKEGETIFRLDPAERRKAALMSRPAHDGTHAFARFLAAQATLRHGDHASARGVDADDPACVPEAMDALMAAMLGVGDAAVAH
ncbi:MAG: amidohydrolase [Burkholderiales bacterium]|nr:amidohydrolase [Burkholderiales bacterium]